MSGQGRGGRKEGRETEARRYIYIHTYIHIYNIYIYKVYIYKVYIYKVYIYKVYIYKVYIYKVYIYKVYIYKVCIYKVYIYIYCIMAGGTPRGEYILFVLEFAPPISYGITKCVCVGGVVCVCI